MNGRLPASMKAMMIHSIAGLLKWLIEASDVEKPPVERVDIACVAASSQSMPAIFSEKAQAMVSAT